MTFSDHSPTAQAADLWARPYQTQAVLNLYDSPALERLATQAAPGRYLRVVSPRSPENPASALEVYLCEDDYPGWIAPTELEQLAIAPQPYQPVAVDRATIQTRIPTAIAFTHAAMQQPNEYCWGGTVAPNYDCSGLMQAAFASVGIWLPRDAYQQEAFTQAIAVEAAEPGDLIFFGTPEKATHVGLYLGDRRYIHSSGKSQGHNGIAIDVLTAEGGGVSATYYAQLRGAGRILQSYCPRSP